MGYGPPNLPRKPSQLKHETEAWACIYCGSLNPVEVFACRGCGANRTQERPGTLEADLGNLSDAPGFTAEAFKSAYSGPGNAHSVPPYHINAHCTEVGKGGFLIPPAYLGRGKTPRRSVLGRAWGWLTTYKGVY